MIACAFGGNSAAAALLYLVTEELLLEAHEEGSDHVWWVDVMFFAGFIASILIEKAAT
jgi:zinc transporter ZupT